MGAEKSTFWNDENTEQLKVLFAKGLSASQIAAELGAVSRNAVIGKLHRLGDRRTPPAKVVGEKKAKPKRAGTRAKSRARPNYYVEDARTVDPKPPTPVKPPSALDAATPMGQRCTLMDLTSETCRFPIGDPRDADFFFCGALPDPGSPYCSTHKAIAYDTTSLAQSRYSYKDTNPHIR